MSSTLSKIDLTTSPSPSVNTSVDVVSLAPKSPETPVTSSKVKKGRRVLVPGFRIANRDELYSDSDSEEENVQKTTIEAESSAKATPHTQPQWLEMLTRNFAGEIIERCSTKTREAVESDKFIEVG